MARLNNYNIMQAAIWYTAGNILIRGVAFFALPIFTSLMDPHDYGIYSVYTSYLSLAEVVILFGLSSTVSLAKFTDGMDFESYLSTALVIPPLLAFLAGCGINLYLWVGEGQLLDMRATLWNFLLLNSAVSAVSSIIQANLILDGRYQLNLAYSALTLLGNLGLSLLLCYTVFRTHDIYMSRVIGSCVASAAGMFLLLQCVRLKRHIQPDYFRQAFRWGLPLLFHTLATVVLTQTDRILVKYMDSYSASGIYSVAVTVTMIPLTLQASLNSAWQPWLYNELEKKNNTAIQKMNHVYIILFAVITAELCLIAPEIIHLCADERYWDSIYSLAPLLISVFGEMLYSIPVSLEYFHKKTMYIMTGTLICAACNIVLDILFIHWWGYIAAAYATMLSKLLLFLLHYLFSRKTDAIHMFQKRYVVGSLAFLGGVNVLTVTYAENAALRLSLFAVIGLLFLWLVRKNWGELSGLLRPKT